MKENSSNILKFIIIFCLSFFIFIKPSFSETSGRVGEHGIDMGISQSFGSLTYYIGGVYTDPEGNTSYLSMPISQLKFPLDFHYAYFNARSNINDNWNYDIGIRNEIDTPSNYLEDSDWISSYSYNNPDIYSDSKVNEFDYLSISLEFKRKLLKTEKSFANLIFNFSFSRYYFACTLLKQYSPSGLYTEYNTGEQSDTAIKYKAETYIPYVGLGSGCVLGKHFSYEGKILFSPLSMAKDKDRHLLRDKESTCEYTGTALLASFAINYEIAKHFYISLMNEISHSEMKGKQTQYENDNYLGELDSKLKVQQTFISNLSLIYNF